MTAFDYAVLAVLALSALVGVWRGLVSEILALAAWVVAFVAARTQAHHVVPLLEGTVADPVWRLAAAYAAVFVGVLVVFAAGRLVLSLLVKAVGLGALDRTLGACFGVLRGVVIVVLAVLVAGLTKVPAQPWWREAALAPPLETLVIAGKPWLPADIAKRIKYR